MTMMKSPEETGGSLICSAYQTLLYVKSFEIAADPGDILYGNFDAPLQPWCCLVLYIILAKNVL